MTVAAPPKVARELPEGTRYVTDGVRLAEVRESYRVADGVHYRLEDAVSSCDPLFPPDEQDRFTITSDDLVDPENPERGGWRPVA